MDDVSWNVVLMMRPLAVENESNFTYSVVADRFPIKAFPVDTLPVFIEVCMIVEKEDTLSKRS